MNVREAIATLTTWSHMSRVIPESKVNRIVLTAANYIQNFYNALDSEVIKVAGLPGGITDVFGAMDKTLDAQKWELTNDWLQTNGSWTPPDVQGYRISQKFIKAWPTPSVWASGALVASDDPYGIFLPQPNSPRERLIGPAGDVHHRRID
jgi:hypothetical protein